MLESVSYQSLCLLQFNLAQWLGGKASPFIVTKSRTVIHLHKNTRFKLAVILHNLLYTFKILSLWRKQQTIGRISTEFVLYILMIATGIIPASHLVFHGDEQAHLINYLNKFNRTGLGTLNTKLVKIILLQGPLATVGGFAAGVLLQYLEESSWSWCDSTVLQDIFKAFFILYQLWDITWLITLGSVCALPALFLSYTAIFIGARSVVQYVHLWMFIISKMQTCPYKN